MVRESIPFAGEIDPLGMAELVAHEVKVSLTSQAHGHESDHLVKCDSSVHYHARCVLAHIEVDLSIE